MGRTIFRLESEVKLERAAMVAACVPVPQFHEDCTKNMFKVIFYTCGRLKVSVCAFVLWRLLLSYHSYYQLSLNSLVKKLEKLNLGYRTVDYELTNLDAIFPFFVPFSPAATRPRSPPSTTIVFFIVHTIPTFWGFLNTSNFFYNMRWTIAPSTGTATTWSIPPGAPPGPPTPGFCHQGTVFPWSLDIFFTNW